MIYFRKYFRLRLLRSTSSLGLWGIFWTELSSVHRGANVQQKRFILTWTNFGTLKGRGLGRPPWISACIYTYIHIWLMTDWPSEPIICSNISISVIFVACQSRTTKHFRMKSAWYSPKLDCTFRFQIPSWFCNILWPMGVWHNLTHSLFLLKHPRSYPLQPNPDHIPMESEKLEYSEHSLDSLPLTLMMERSPMEWPSTPDPFEDLEEFRPDQAFGYVPGVPQVLPLREKIELPDHPQRLVPNFGDLHLIGPFQPSDLAIAVPVAVGPWPEWPWSDLPNLPVEAPRNHKEPGMGQVAWTKELEMLLVLWGTEKRTCYAILIIDMIHHNIEIFQYR